MSARSDEAGTSQIEAVVAHRHADGVGAVLRDQRVGTGVAGRFHRHVCARREQGAEDEIEPMLGAVAQHHRIGRERCAEAGADTFVAGSAVYSADDANAMVGALRNRAVAACRH